MKNDMESYKVVDSRADAVYIARPLDTLAVFADEGAAKRFISHWSDAEDKKSMRVVPCVVVDSTFLESLHGFIDEHSITLESCCSFQTSEILDTLKRLLRLETDAEPRPANASANVPEVGGVQ